MSLYLTTESAAGSGPGSFVENSTGTRVTLATPANPGDNLFGLAVGLGATNPASPVGPATATSSVPTLPTVTVGGVNANVTFAGVTSGVGDGVYQVNFAVPSGLQGTQNVVINLDGVTSTSVASPQITSPVNLPIAGLSSIVNSGSFAAPGTASPGSIVTAFANNLGTTTNVESALFPATSSEGIQITFNGTAAPLLNVVASTAQQQVDLVVPSNLPTSGTVNVQLTTSTALYPNYTLNMVPANPGFYAFTDPKMTTRRNVVAEFNNTVAPLEKTLAEQPYFGGAAANYADYILFSMFQYARLGCPDDASLWAQRWLADE